MRLPSIPYDHVPFADLYYLTGYNRPGGTLTMHKRNGNLISTLFLPPPDRNEEISSGFRTRFPTRRR
jgi:hypothetical protein